jgi:hypothetical protein
MLQLSLNFLLLETSINVSENLGDHFQPLRKSLAVETKNSWHWFERTRFPNHIERCLSHPGEDLTTVPLQSAEYLPHCDAYLNGGDCSANTR